MDLLDSINDPADLRRMNVSDLPALAAEVRAALIRTVCRTGGHLGPNLGVVELSIALHRVFVSPRVPLVFDTGHQAYVHKMLTGRRAGMATLRSAGGLSGYPSRRESAHDQVENSHASTSLSYADGLAKAFALTGRAGDPVVAVVGDGALTGGLAFEALNNIGAGCRNVIVVLNDNGRSYSPTAGGLARHLGRVADRAGYASAVRRLGGDPDRTGPDVQAGAGVGRDMPAGAGRDVQAGAGIGRDMPAGRGWTGSIFAALGFDYLGPVDGHDIAALEGVLADAAVRGGPIVVHCRTRKGHGYPPAEDDPADRMHTVGVLDPRTGRPSQPAAVTWTDTFADALVAQGARRRDLVAVTAAMLGPTGLQRFADRFPARCFDVGIAEAHAVTSAAGMAMAGLHPVVALYATFAGRAFDEALMDVGLHRLPVTLVLDRAGITGPDGPSHHGMWDLAMLGVVPGMRVAAPRDAITLVDELDEAVATADGPTVLRFPKAALGPSVPSAGRIGGVDVLYPGPVRSSRTDGAVLIVGVGPLCGAAVAAAQRLAEDGIPCTVVDPRWVLPIDADLVDLAARYRTVATVEDGIRVGGVGSRLAAALADRGVNCRVRSLGLPGEFIPQGSRAELLSRYGLDAVGIAESVAGFVGCGGRADGGPDAAVDPAPAWSERLIPVRRAVG